MGPCLHAAQQDYSQSGGWAADCWWNRHVICYGPPGLKKDHPLVAWLAADGHAKSLSIYKDGCAGAGCRTLPCTAVRPSRRHCWLSGLAGRAPRHRLLARLQV